jgi:UPF0176 protein
LSSLIHSSFYRFVNVPEPEAAARQLRVFASKSPDLTGAILIAGEGINGTVAGPATVIEQFEIWLKLQPYGAFNYKHSFCATPPFARFKVQVKAEIVQMGVRDINVIDHRPKSLNPREWSELLDQDNVVVIDNRNRFEFRLGHFKGAINPDVNHFKDFPSFIKSHIPTWQAEGKKIAMYCTGGIRCDKTSAWMAQEGLDTFVLDGGILSFFEQRPNDQRWEGECFVFDNRIAINSKRQETETSIESVYEDEADGAWRIARAKRLLSAAVAHGTLQHEPPLKYERKVPFNEAIVFEDELIVIADKPHFLPVQASGTYVEETLTARLIKRTGCATLTPAHRIDRDTAGLVLLIKKPEHRAAYQNLFRDRLIEKEYEAIAQHTQKLSFPIELKNRLARSEDQFMQAVIEPGNPNAISVIEFIEAIGFIKKWTQAPLARYRLKPLTGQRHQLRVHMNSLGLPILNDQIYPVVTPEIEDTDFAWQVRYEEPLQLLAKSIAFIDPFTGEHRRFESQFKLGA